MSNEIYTLRLTLERMPGQVPMAELLRIPRPSQLDEWELYEQLEREQIRQTQGQAEFDTWMITRNVERMERAQWRRMMEFRLAARESEQEEREKRQEAGDMSHLIMWRAGGGSDAPRRRKVSEIFTDLMPPSEVDEQEVNEAER